MNFYINYNEVTAAVHIAAGVMIKASSPCDIRQLQQHRPSPSFNEA